MTQGIVFYYTNSSYDTLIPPSLYSLRQHYSGPVHVVCNNVSDWFKKGIDGLPGFTMSEESPNKYWGSGHKSHLWCRKAYHHMKEYPFDINLYFDLDHIWQKPLDNHPIFNKCARSGMVACSSNIPPYSETRKRLAVENTLGIKLPNMYGTNGGCVCARRGDPLIAEWIRRMDIFLRTDTHFLKNNPEEFALASMYSEGLMPAETFEEMSFPIGPPTFESKLPDLSKYNLHGTRGTLIRLKAFWDAYAKVESSNFMNAQAILTDEVKTRFKGYREHAVG